MNSGAPEGLEVPAPLAAPVVLNVLFLFHLFSCLASWNHEKISRQEVSFIFVVITFRSFMVLIFTHNFSFCIPLSWCTKFRRLMVPAKSTNIVMQRIQIHSQYTCFPLMYISYDSDRLFLNTDHNYFNCIVLVAGRWHDNGVIDPCRGCLISLSQCYLFYLKKKKKQT